MLNAINETAEKLGLHPFVGFGMFAIDWMLFGGEAVIPVFGSVFVAIIGIILIVPSVLIQKNSFGDDWGAAIGKGIIVGLLTAIPTALPSVIVFTGGAIGTVKLITD